MRAVNFKECLLSLFSQAISQESDNVKCLLIIFLLLILIFLIIHPFEHSMAICMILPITIRTQRLIMINYRANVLICLVAN
jgi:hypothetical protein